MTRSANCARYVEIDRYVISKRWDATTNEQHERLGSISWRLSIPVGAFLLREIPPASLRSLWKWKRVRSYEAA